MREEVLTALSQVLEGIRMLMALETKQLVHVCLFFCTVRTSASSQIMKPFSVI